MAVVRNWTSLKFNSILTQDVISLFRRHLFYPATCVRFASKKSKKTADITIEDLEDTIKENEKLKLRDSKTEKRVQLFYRKEEGKTRKRPSVTQQYKHFVESEDPFLESRQMRQESIDFAEGLQKKLEIKDPLTVFRRAQPSVLGTSKEELEKMFKKMREAGFQTSECTDILKGFPPAFVIDYNHLFKVCQVLTKYNITWQDLLRNGFEIFSLDPNVLEERLKMLVDNGIKMKNLTLIENCPSILMFPLNKETLEKFKVLKKMGFFTKWLSKGAFQSLLSHAHEIELDENARDVAKMLKQLGISPDFIVTKGPSVFKQDAAHLKEIICLLSSGPLYLEARVLKYFIISFPNWFGTVDPTLLKRRLMVIDDLLKEHSSVDALFNVLANSLELLNPAKKVEESIKYLTDSAGFTKIDIAIITLKSVGFLCQDVEAELKPKLQLLQSIPGVNNQFIVSIGYRYFQKKLDFLQRRINYVKDHCIDLLKANLLEDLFRTSEDDFISFCRQHQVQTVASSTAVVPSVKEKLKSGKSSKKRGRKASTTPDIIELDLLEEDLGAQDQGIDKQSIANESVMCVEESSRGTRLQSSDDEIDEYLNTFSEDSEEALEMPNVEFLEKVEKH